MTKQNECNEWIERWLWVLGVLPLGLWQRCSKSTCQKTGVDYAKKKEAISGKYKWKVMTTLKKKKKKCNFEHGQYGYIWAVNLGLCTLKPTGNKSCNQSLSSCCQDSRTPSLGLRRFTLELVCLGPLCFCSVTPSYKLAWGPEEPSG